MPPEKRARHDHLGVDVSGLGEGTGQRKVPELKKIVILIERLADPPAEVQAAGIGAVGLEVRDDELPFLMVETCGQDHLKRVEAIVGASNSSLDGIQSEVQGADGREGKVEIGHFRDIQRRATAVDAYSINAAHTASARIFIYSSGRAATPGPIEKFPDTSDAMAVRGTVHANLDPRRHKTVSTRSYGSGDSGNKVERQGSLTSGGLRP
jgi:hypothetical protein